MLDEIGRYAVLRAANSVGGQRMLARGHRLRVGEQGIVGYVTGTGRPRIALDVGADAVHFVNPDLPHTRSEMALPLAVRGRVIGALDVQSEEPAAFDDEDVAVLGTLADQIAVALDNARLFEESQASLRDMQAVQAQYTRQAWRAFSTQQEARTIEYTRSGVAPLGDQLLPELVLSPVEVVDRVSRVGEAVVTSGDGDSQTPASLIVPLKLYGQTIGVLGFQETEPGRLWAGDEIDLVEAAAYEIAQVLESARLFEDAQQRAWREQTAGQITARVRASTGVEDILQTAAEELGRALGVSRAIVRLDVRGTSLNPEAPAGQ
jgi:GAF domain-containing protein